MGDRVSISFKKNGQESVALFCHWGGTWLPKRARNYVKELKRDIKSNKDLVTWPLGRLEPDTVMVDFIRDLHDQGELTYGSNKRVLSNYYLGRDEHDGDNSDNGHFVIEL